MKTIVFFPTNNIGKYDRYKNSFEKEKMVYNRYLIENNTEVKVDVVEDGHDADDGLASVVVHDVFPPFFERECLSV